MSQRFTGDGPRRGWRERFRRFLLDLDSRLDFGLFKSTIWGRELFERFAEFMDKFHVGGWRRLVDTSDPGFVGEGPAMPPRTSYELPGRVLVMLLADRLGAPAAMSDAKAEA